MYDMSEVNVCPSSHLFLGGAFGLFSMLRQKWNLGAQNS